MPVKLEEAKEILAELDGASPGAHFEEAIRVVIRDEMRLVLDPPNADITARADTIAAQHLASVDRQRRQGVIS